jgi:hypothetical protein
METGKEDSTFRQESRQEMAKHAPCTGVSGAQGVSQGAQGNEKRGDQGDAAALASSGSVEWLLWMEGALGNLETNGHCGRKDCVEVEAPRNQPSHVAVDGVRVRHKPDGSEGGQSRFSDAEDESSFKRFHAAVSMRLIGSSFMTWHLRCQEGDPVAVSLSMDIDFDQTMRTLQSRSSFERQLEDDICSTLSIERERVTILCHQKGSVLSEIVFGKPDARQVAQQFVAYVEQKEASLVKTPTGKLVQKAEVHGPVCQGTVGALARAKARASDAASISVWTGSLVHHATTIVPCVHRFNIRVDRFLV